MLKKIVLGLFIISGAHAFADSIQSSDVISDKPKVLNSPTVGSKQYGNFAHPKLKGKKGQRYYTNEQLSNPKNSPTQGGSKAYSTQTFGLPKVSGQKGKEYYTRDQLSDGPNQSTDGSKIGSNQVFGYPNIESKK